MHVTTTSLPDVLLLHPRRFSDDRGWFEESWSARALAQDGVHVGFVQDNHSLSRQAGTVRGLHFQAPPHAQDKLVRCTRGAIFDVAVDIRRGSPSYGRWAGEELTPENGRQLFVPKGFLHGFVTLEPDTEVQYKCSDYYAPECDGSVRWDSVGINWPVSGSPVLSAKDAAAVAFADFRSPFVYGETA
jgi:dTDP-4-dehydrorhamnose 3,5-epimerase